jgi:cardiolipin synthase
MAEVENARQVSCTWFRTGGAIFPAMLRAIEEARQFVRLETYIYSPGELANRFLNALIQARKRGAQVRVLVDAFGASRLPAKFFEPLTAIGGEARLFNPLAWHRFGIRDHRKLLACDGRVAFIGGFNIAPEYEGDGVACGWCDLGLQIEGALAAHLEVSFDDMFARAEFKQKRFARLRRLVTRRSGRGSEQLLLSGPGLGANPFKKAVRSDFRTAKDICIIAAYFLPSWRMRHELARVVRRGGRVRIVLPGKTDVLVSKLAAQSLYRRLLRAGVQIFEYQPQILHAKLIITGDIVYVGSANFDQRSLNINYELMVRFKNSRLAEDAHQVFDAVLQNSKPILYESWRNERSIWSRLKQRWAYLLLARLDPYIAERQWRAMPD